MSSSGDPPDEDPRPDDNAAPIARQSSSTFATSWEIQEIVAAALLLVIAVLAGAGVASAIIGSTSQVDGFATGESVAQVLLESTQWAGVLASFLILSAVGLIWWQTDGWVDAFADLDCRPDEERRGRRGRAPHRTQQGAVDMGRSVAARDVDGRRRGDGRLGPGNHPLPVAAMGLIRRDSSWEP